MMRLFLVLFACLMASAQTPGWWMTEPVRWVQTNLRQTDASLDARQLVGEVVRLRANVLHFGMGGIAAYYPTEVAFHTRSPFLPAGHDLFGEVLREAHGRGIRVVGRFDLSKTRRDAYEAHPEWFFRKSDGGPVEYNGLYSVCINAGWYQEHAFRILGEALDRYDVDGLFFNMFGNQSSDYSGNFVGHCHCDACRRKYRARFGRDLPQKMDDEYRAWIRECALDVAGRIGALIHEKRPKAGYFNYLLEHTDGVMSESNTALNRPLPLWLYSASENVNRARNSQPGKMAVNLCMQFVDYAWRFATVPQDEIRLRLWQNLAQGGALAFSLNGTFDQQDRQAVEAARPVFQWAADNQQYYVGQESAARVLLLQGGDAEAYRGLYRLLSEEHIAFAVANNLDWIGKREFDLVVTAGRAPRELSAYTSRGGRLLAVSADKPEFVEAGLIETRPDAKGYVRVRDASRFPSLALTSILLLNGRFAVTPDQPAAPLTLIPPSMFGPPEFIHTDMKETRTPALLTFDEGKVVWLPWDLGAIYYRLSLPAHRGLFRDVANALLPAGRQIETSAHPLIEMTLMRQGRRTLLHMVNLSGHSQTGYFEPIPMRDIRVGVQGAFRTARALRLGRSLEVDKGFTLPQLGDYELIVLE